MKILVDHGAYGNLGDTAMLEAVLARLRHLMPQAEVYVISRPQLHAQIWDEPQVFPQAQYGVRPFCSNLFHKLPYLWRHNDAWQKSMSTLTLLYARNIGSATKLRLSPPGEGAEVLGQFCEPFDSLHVVGGGNLTDTFPAELFRRSLILYAFAAQKKPIVLTGQQLGPFTSWFSKSALAGALRTACFIGLRESGDSLKFCKDAGLDEKKVEVMGDDSLDLLPAEGALVCQLLSRYSLSPGSFLAANIRLSPYSPEHTAHVEKMGALMGRLACQFQMPVLIVPVALNPTDSDVASGRGLMQAAKGAPVAVMDERELTPALVKAVIGRAFGAIGSSYHFCTFALSQAVPAVCLYDGVYYSQKARGLCDFWQDSRLGLPLREADVARAVIHCVEVLADLKLRERLTALSQEVVERWRQIFDRRVGGCLRSIA